MAFAPYQYLSDDGIIYQVILDNTLAVEFGYIPATGQEPGLPALYSPRYASYLFPVGGISLNAVITRPFQLADPPPLVVFNSNLYALQSAYGERRNTGFVPNVVTIAGPPGPKGDPGQPSAINILSGDMRLNNGWNVYHNSQKNPGTGGFCLFDSAGSGVLFGYGPGDAGGIAKSIVGDCLLQLRLLDFYYDTTGSNSLAQLIFDDGTNLNGISVLNSGSAYGVQDFNTSQGGTLVSISALPLWLRLQRVSGVVTAYYSFDGNSWIALSGVTLTPLSANINAAITTEGAYNQQRLGYALFDNLTLT